MQPSWLGFCRSHDGFKSRSVFTHEITAVDRLVSLLAVVAAQQENIGEFESNDTNKEELSRSLLQWRI